MKTDDRQALHDRLFADAGSRCALDTGAPERKADAYRQLIARQMASWPKST